MNRAQLDELLLQALETERGGVSVYETAIKCARNDDLRSEWEEYLEQTKHHEQVVRACSSNSASTRPARRRAVLWSGTSASRWSRRWSRRSPPDRPRRPSSWPASAS